MKLAVKEFVSKHSLATESKDAVLIHGTGAKAEMWQDQIEILVSLGYRCIVPDLRGHGDSLEPNEITNIQVHLKDMLETLENIDLRKPALFVGHSLGAIISLELAALKPDMVSKILAVSMPGKVPEITVSAFRFLLTWPYRILKGSFIHKNLAWRERVLIDTNHFSLFQIVENFADLNYCDYLPNLSCPVHFAVGRLDPVAPYQHVLKMQKKLPNSTVKIIEWAGHNCMDSQKSAFNHWFITSINN